jgi:hypothetical protein
MIDLVFFVIIAMFGTIWWDKQRKSYFSPLMRASFSPPVRENFEPFKVTKSFSPSAIDVGSLYGYRAEGYNTTPRRGIATCTDREGVFGNLRWCESPYFSNAGDYVAKTLTTVLVGDANPRTRFAPIIAPQITDIDAWGTDNHTVHSSTNQSSSEELYLTGYVSDGQCPSRQDYIQPRVNCTDGHWQLETVPQILQNAAISSLPRSSLTRTHDPGEVCGTGIDVWHSSNNSSEHAVSLRPAAVEELSVENVLDPRSSAFASPVSGCERSYVDKRLGQGKFYYDDINLGKGSNYITRNKIDMYSFAEQTGRFAHPDENCGDNRDQVLAEFHAAAVDRRVNLQQSWMNKRDRERWQQKMFPITTNGQRMLGSAVKI